MGSSQSGQAWVQGWGQVEVGGAGSQSVARARANGRPEDAQAGWCGVGRGQSGGIEGWGCREGKPLHRPGLFLICPDGAFCGVIRPGLASFTHPQLRGVLLLAASQCLPVRRPQ